MTTKKVISQINDGWAEVAPGEGGQGELLHTPALEPIYIPLADIEPNPFQPRASEDPAAILEVAASIYINGLMQIPMARAVNGHYELVFGHTRKAAFEILARQGLPDREIAPDARFEVMPLRIGQLTDRQMFEMALSENLRRRDLNPIELAAAMKRYMDEFSASSTEAGELFGLAGTTVRGMIRLLKLPEKTQEKVASGEITQGVARQLVSVAQIDEAAAAKAADRIVAGNEPRYVFQSTFDGSKTVVKMWERWSGGTPLGGPGLWPLDMTPKKFPASRLPELTAKEVARSLGVEPGSYDYIDALRLRAREDVLEQHGPDAELIERTDHLLHPPACAACPFYLQMSGDHFCGLKACHQRKSAAWVTAEADRLSKAMGIALYNPEQDGKDSARLSPTTWDDHYEADKKLVADKDPSLRLICGKGAQSDPFTKHEHIHLVQIGESATERKAQARHERSDDYHKEQQAEWARLNATRQASRSFLSEYGTHPFAAAFAGLDNPQAVAALARRKLKTGAKKSEQLQELHLILARDALNNVVPYSALERGPVAMAKFLEKVAVTWGVKLPADFRDVAKGYAVSTETPAVKRSK